MNALQTIQKAVRLLGIMEVPASLEGTTDPQVVELTAILTDVGQELATRHNWNTLGAFFAFPSTAENPQREPFPSDWDGSFSNASVWRSGSLLTPLSGPCNPDVWHRLLTIPGIRFPGYWRQFDGNLEIIGAPADETVTLQYVSNGWVVGANGARKDEVTKDTDTFVLPDRLLSLGCIYRWRSSKGLSYAEEMASFERQFEIDVARDRAARPMSVTWPFRPNAALKSWPGLVTPSTAT